MNHLIATVRTIYQAFGRGDVPTILELLHPDVEWEHDAIDHGIPWLRPGRGRDHVAAFLGEVSKLEFHAFAPEAFLTDESRVAVFVRHEVTNPATGKRFAGVEIHYWTFDETGRVSRMKHFADTAQHKDAATR
ncbi:MAG TPA: nuclear transport factor 2 family protein [Polyangiaceae bacterium]